VAKTWKTRAKRFSLVVLGLLAVLVLGVLVAGVVANEPRPSGRRGPRADALARRVMASVNADAWDETDYVVFTFMGRHRYVWDRARGYVEADLGDVHVFLPLEGGRSIVYENGHAVTRTEDKKRLREKAMRAFVNDSFWLNPIVRLFDDDVVREIVERDGREMLMMRYVRGGFTPGDAYLFELDTNARPSAWRMWVSVIPVGGLRTTFEGYVRLRTGALVSTVHGALGRSSAMITNVRGGRSFAEIGVADPFGPLAHANP
jgi:hypothetical protein